MSELDYRIEHFDQSLSHIRGKRIWIYGLGKNTGAVIRSFDPEYHFRGIIAPEPVSCGMENGRFGKPVVTMEEALAQRPEVILIGAQMYSAEDIYQRIHPVCREHGIRLLDLYGFDQIRLHDEIEGHCFQGLQGWEELTRGYDVVSLTLIDAVLVRDMFGNRPARMRPMFVRLLRTLAARGTKIVGIEEAEYPADWYDQSLATGGFSTESFDRICVREHTERFFRDLKNDYPQQRILHIGPSLLGDVIIPRLCGLDSYRMVYFDKSRLTAFETSGDQDSFVPDAGEGWPEMEALPAETIREEIAQSAGVTCDVFDTLLMRRTLCPEDVFVLTAYAAHRRGLLKDRQETDRWIEVRIQEQTRCFTFREIYEAVGERIGLARDTSDRIAALELETERAVLVPGRSAAELLDYAASCKKKIVLVTDMYLKKSDICSLLEENGIGGYDQIFVSSEQGLSKQEGLLSVVSGQCFTGPGRIVHIGDDMAAESEWAGKAGSQFIAVPTPYGLKPVREMAEAAGSVLERLLLGMVLTRLYADPIGKSGRERRLYDYGFCAVAPAVIGWTCWFLRQLRGHPAEKVLFAARDGYLFKQVYDRLRTDDHPESVYYYTSRHAAFLTCADCGVVTDHMTGMDPELDGENMLSRYYDIPGQRQKAAGTPQERIEANLGQIRETARTARRGQQAYWEQTGLKEQAEYAFFDFLSSGTTQRMIEETAKFHLQGYYFGRNELSVFSDGIKTFLRGEGESEKEFVRRYMEMEYYLMSPEPSLRGYDKDGSLIFAEETRGSGEIDDLRTVHRAVRDFLDIFARICPVAEEIYAIEDVSPEFICRLYLKGAADLPKRRYFDDWSMQWLRQKK